jgi:glycerol uptake facilitator-like aquaporin
MITMLTARVSGAHYNPMVTFVCMFKKDNEENFPKKLGFVYMAAQFIGAFLGALLSYFLNLNGGALNIRPGYVF